MTVKITDTSTLALSSFDIGSFDAIVVGAGFAGAVAARELAERKGLRVVILERRGHIAGNAYDELDEHGVLIHRYGPHIYHTVSERVHGYLSRFTEWRDYQHEVLANIHGSYIPVPFNLNSIALCFETEKARRISELLIATFGMGTKVPIIELRALDEPLLKELAEYVYENVFLHYTEKQWGLTPEQIDPAVTARVPVLVDWDNRYFQDPWQGMPAVSYSALFDRLLDHPNIEVLLNVDARDVLVLREGVRDTSMSDEGARDTGSQGASLSEQSANPSEQAANPREQGAIQAIEVDGVDFQGPIVYTGALDELCKERFGMLPYRSLDFVYRHYDKHHVQPCAVLNFTTSEAYTRTTEYNWLTGQEIESSTVLEEYSQSYENPTTQIPYYPIVGAKNQDFYEQYLRLFRAVDNFYVVGRLAEYRYYNMDQIVLRALELVDELG